MTVRKHALLLFSKPPVPGLVKTRLTHAKGGLFTEEEAAMLFHNTLFDVAELCCSVMHELEQANQAERAGDPSVTEHHFGFFVSTTPAENVERIRSVFEDAGEWPYPITYLLDSGATFDEHFDDAFQQIFALGYDSVLSVGGDIPMLPRRHLIEGFLWLMHFLENNETGGIVEAPCQECGVSLIGWTRATDMSHEGVYYNMSGRPALDAYVQKASEKNIPIASLAPVADIDDMQDLAHAISLARSARYCQRFQPDLYVPERFLSWVEWKGLRVGTPPNEDRDSREGIDAPASS
jgi:glycosyltransferase A (GT-A) superfamily protein (DUF2064 family)